MVAHVQNSDSDSVREEVVAERTSQKSELVPASAQAKTQKDSRGSDHGQQSLLTSRIKELSREDIEIGDLLGSGSFSSVYEILSIGSSVMGTFSPICLRSVRIHQDSRSSFCITTPLNVQKGRKK